MKTLLTTALVATLTATAYAQGTPPAPCTQPCSTQPASAQPAPAPVDAAYSQPAQPAATAASNLDQPAQPATTDVDDDETGWHRPAGRRFFHGFRVGAMYLANYDAADTRRDNMSLKQKFGLSSPYMMLLGYEGFYRIVGHSWLNVILVGNASVAGLDQSKFIPAVSGLIGVELDKSFQLGVGVNLLPDPVAPSHAIFAAGWTPKVGSIQTPIHFFYIPDHGDPMAPAGTSSKNWRTGVTLGLNW
jgi:hypothetical protein